MRFRSYTPADIEAMYLLDLACFTAPYQFDREMMREVAEAANAIVVIIDDDNAMLGFVIVHIQGMKRNRHAYIVTIDVAQSARRQGVGARLLQQVEAQAVASGLPKIGLHVAIDNAPAIAFYQRQGYEQVGVERNFYREAATDALVYVKQL
jgi:ribosomal-protein-alanine N-acetyltransferase